MTFRLARAFFTLLLVCSLAAGAYAALKPDRGLLDFSAFYMAGVAQREGLDPYGIYPELAAATGHNFGYDDDRGHSPNLNPPISTYPLRLLADTNPGDVKAGLNVVSAVLFAACAVAMLRAYPQHRTVQGVIWIAAFGGFWYSIGLGQVYVFLFVPALAAWLLIQRGSHPVLAGVLIGLLVAVKPHFAIWPLFLLLAGHPRIALPSFGVAAAISAVPLLLEGPGIYRQWLDAVEAYPRIGLPINASVIGVSERLGIIEAGYAISGAIVAAAASMLWRSRVTAVRASAWAITVALVAMPIAWIGYSLMAMPVLLSRRWHIPEWTAAAGMTAVWYGLGRGEPLLAASLILLCLLARDQLHRRELGRTVQEALALNALNRRARSEQPRTEAA